MKITKLVSSIFSPNPVKKNTNSAALKMELEKIANEKSQIGWIYGLDSDTMTREDVKYFEKRKKILGIREGWINKQLQKLEGKK